MHEYRFKFEDLPIMRWKNGGGITREIACVDDPALETGFGWRISIAEITQSGAFSLFPEVDRTIVLLSGGGVLLSKQGAWQHRLDTPLQPFMFSGDEDCYATVLGGPSRDFNVMTCRKKFRHKLQIVSDRLIPDQPNGAFFIQSGSWQDDSGQRWQSGEGYVWKDSDKAPPAISALSLDGMALIVSIVAETA